jgi:hypothetical protein
MMIDDYEISQLIESPDDVVEAAAAARSGKTREQRELETSALIARANDSADEYDAHHGDDRSIVSA